MNKKIFWILFVLLVLFVVPVALAQGEEPPAPLTLADFPWLETLLTAGVVFIVTAGIKSFGEVFKIDITGKATAITAALVLFIVEIVNTGLSVIPPSAAPIVTAAMGFIATLLAAFGYAGLLKRKKLVDPNTPTIVKK